MSAIDDRALPKAKVIVNPTANHGETEKEIGRVSRFLENHFACDIVLTTRRGHATELAREVDGFDVVIAVGGDGTAFEVANGLAKSGHADVPMAIVPTGSGNDLRRALGISKRLDRALEQISESNTCHIDLGRVNDTYYANSLGIGFDARVAHLTNHIKDEVKRSGIPLYLTALFRVLFNDYYCHPVRIKIDDGEWIEQEVVLVAVNNGTSYGGGFKITPRAKNDDGLLEVCIVDKLSRRQVIPRLPFVILGKHSWMKDIRFYPAKKVVVESAEALPAHLDGELMLSRVFEVEVVPRALKVVTGRKTGRLKTED